MCTNRSTYNCISGWRCGRGYGLSNLVGDAVLTLASFGLWLVWIIIREARS